jgi:tripartite-type tricarboxylate transporter receptor subunit TctC
MTKAPARRVLIGSLMVAAALVAARADVRADAVADFYRGKQVKLIVGYGPGGGYDVYARLLARHLGRYIPGNPAVVVQNMPGAGSLRAANYIYVSAPKDGTVIGTFSRDMPLFALLGNNANVQFDSRKFTWLGSSSSYGNDAYLLIMRADAAVKSIEEGRRPGGPPLVLGSTGEGASGSDVPAVLRDALGLNIKLVLGYPDSPSLNLAIDRKELEGRTTGLSSVKSSKPEWLRPSSGMQVLLQFGRAGRHPDFPDVPTARELARDDNARALIELVELPFLLSRPFVAPPGLPPDRAKALQSAFMAVHDDSQYREEAGKFQVDISPIGGEEAVLAIDRIYGAPPELHDTMRKILGEHKGGG